MPSLGLFIHKQSNMLWSRFYLEIEAFFLLQLLLSLLSLEYDNFIPDVVSYIQFLISYLLKYVIDKDSIETFS